MGTEQTKARTATGAQTIRANGQAAEACALGADGKCAFCGRVGLPVLPLRYAVTPSFLPGGVADPTTWAKLGTGLKGKPPEGLKGHRYALRTLRKGFVMVYFGSGLWHTYAVTASGLLRKLADPDDPDFKTDREMTPACLREGHNVPASFITIPLIPVGATRALPTKFWIAFSDVPWTRRVRQKYEGAGAAGARTGRMQEFSTDPLGKQADTVADAFQLHPDEDSTTKRLNRLVLEYAENDAQARSRTEYDAIDPYDPKKRNHIEWESAHGVSMRTGGAPAVAKFSVKPSEFNGQQFMASAIVLNDPLGMVQELNVTRLKVMDSRQRYLSDVRIARPLLISQSILGLKHLIGEQVAATLLEEETSKGLPDVQTERQVFVDDLPRYAQTVTTTTTRKDRVDAKVTSLWSSLQKYYREKERDAFDTTLNATLKRFQDWLVRNDADYAYWLAQPEWVLRRRDFDNESPAQQDVLIEAFALALSGGPSASPSQGQGAPQDSRVYEVWKDFIAKKPTDEANPIYAAIFGDQEGLLEFLLPEGADPTEDKLHKGSKLFKAVKNIIGTKELTSTTLKGVREEGFSLTREATDKVPNPIRAQGAAVLDRIRRGWIPKATGAVANSLFTVGSALSRMAAHAVSEIAQATVLRAIQGAVLLYERREIILVTSRIKVREYLAYLNDVAFRASDMVFDAAARGVRRVAQAGKNTVRSMSVAGVLRISDKKTRDGFIEVMSWAFNELDDVTKAIDALPPAQDAARSARQAAQAATAAETAAMATVMRVHPLTISPGAQKFVDAVVARASAAKAGTANVLEAVTRASLRLSSTGSGILAVASVLVQGWSLKDSYNKADKTFLGNNEARVLLVAGGTAFIGAFAEAIGLGRKLIGATTWGTSLGRLGGAVGGLASIVEGVQAGMASLRTARRGDTDASVLYALSGAAMVVGGAVGIYGALTGAALLGPIGWALLLVVAGVFLLYFAMKAEDSPAAIWLDRCYWGKGSRYANAKNPADRPWTDKEIDDELSQLNAIIMGLAGETGFNDDGWGFTDLRWDTVKAKITFPNYDSADSAFEWTLRAVKGHKAKSVTLASGKHNTLPVDPGAVVLAGRAAPRQNDNIQYFRNLVGPTYRLEGKNKDVLVAEVSVEVAVALFQDIELTAEYVPDTSDPHGRASLVLNEED
ncbi:T6SS effector BTH_I2691 family protein [Variovorax sp. 38R]|uniref:T6SS effector BTH_I2691 family protein n=1 Tax=Variovorax sp. 38R TaxID=2774875 RepID=UPI00177B5EF2|nr:T6SS effector BTH_I2691 family protein [Variovorax sp. 38R]QOF78333.1 hypothetical protein IG196_29250 [Variovorax sp. 38R]